MASMAMQHLIAQDHEGERPAALPPARATAPAWRRWLMVLFFVVLALATTQLQAKAAPSAADDDVIHYTMKRGDTLIGVGQRYFIGANDYKAVQKLNAIRNPHAIATGKVIRIPRDILRYRAVGIAVASARGPVTMNAAPARSDMAVAEGATLRTGVKGFATLAFDNGSRVSLPSNSTLIVRRARIYVIDNSRDVDLELVSGGMRSKVQPMTQAGDRNRVRTRHSVTAVRGTEFGTSVTDDEGVISEVYEGRIALGASLATATSPSDEPLVAAGFGVKLAPSGERTEARLLPAVDLADPGQVQSGETLNFAVYKPIAGASAYRFELASDASFVDQISDDRSTDGTIALPSLPDGRYFVRVSAVDGNGFVGLSVTYAVRRVRSGASASAELDADGYLFKWQVFGARRPDVRFRLYRGDTNGVPMIDEPDLKGSQLRLSDLPPGRYVWQIGTRLVDDGDIIENWTAPETLIVTP